MSARREVFADLHRHPRGVFYNNKQRANRYHATTLFLTRTSSIAAGEAVRYQYYLGTLRNAPLGDLLMAECSFDVCLEKQTRIEDIKRDKHHLISVVKSARDAGLKGRF